jgi:hypothetical protein
MRASVARMHPCERAAHRPLGLVAGGQAQARVDDGVDAVTGYDQTRQHAWTGEGKAPCPAAPAVLWVVADAWCPPLSGRHGDLAAGGGGVCCGGLCDVCLQLQAWLQPAVGHGQVLVDPNVEPDPRRRQAGAAGVGGLRRSLDQAWRASGPGHRHRLASACPTVLTACYLISTCLCVSRNCLYFALCVLVGVWFFGYGHGEPGVTAARL